MQDQIKLSEIQPQRSEDVLLSFKNYNQKSFNNILSFQSNYENPEYELPDISLEEAITSLQYLTKLLNPILSNSLSNKDFTDIFIKTLSTEHNSALNNADNTFSKHSPHIITDNQNLSASSSTSNIGLPIKSLSDSQKKLVFRNISHFFTNQVGNMPFFLQQLKNASLNKLFLKLEIENEKPYLFFSNSIRFQKKYPLDINYTGNFQDGIFVPYGVTSKYEKIELKKQVPRTNLSSLIEKINLKSSIILSKETENRLLWINIPNNKKITNPLDIAKAICFTCDLEYTISNNKILISSHNQKPSSRHFNDIDKFFKLVIPNNIQNYLHKKSKNQDANNTNTLNESSILKKLKASSIRRLMGLYYLYLSNSTEPVSFQDLHPEIKNALSLTFLLYDLPGIAYTRSNYDFLIKNFDNIVLSGGIRKYIDGSSDFSLDYCKRFPDGSLGQGPGFVRRLK